MLLRPQNYPSGARERVDRVWLRELASAVPGCVGRSATSGTGCAGPGIIRWGSRSVLVALDPVLSVGGGVEHYGVCCFGPRIIRRGRGSALTVSGCESSRPPCLYTTLFRSKGSPDTSLVFLCITRSDARDLPFETSRDSYIGRNPLPKIRTHKPTRTTRVLQTVVA